MLGGSGKRGIAFWRRREKQNKKQKTRKKISAANNKRQLLLREGEKETREGHRGKERVKNSTKLWRRRNKRENERRQEDDADKEKG